MESLPWRARVQTVQGNTLGAGLLVANKHLLTCAHVVRDRTEVVVTLPGFVEDLPARVLWRGDWRREGDTGDIAVLELRDPAPTRSCELTTLSASGVGSDSFQLRVYGFPFGHDKDGTHVTLRTSVDRMLSQEWLEVDVDQPHLQRLNEGFSGAAVYLPESEKVVGMLTDAVLDDDRGGFIGRMLPVDTIRRHWEDLDDLLPLEWLADEPRRQLRGLTKEAIATADLNQIFRCAFPAYLRAPHNFTSVWDAIRYVGEVVSGEDRLGRFLRALVPHLKPPVGEGIRAWIQRWIPLSAEPVRLEQAVPQSIIIRLEPLTRGASLELTVCSLVDGMPVNRTGPVRVRRSQVKSRVEEIIARHVPDVHGRDWMIEFVLPETLMNEPFDDWEIKEPGGRPQPLRSVPVVIRHIDRLKPRIASYLARKRWQVLRAEAVIRPKPIHCCLKYSYQEFRDWLDATEELCTLVYAAMPRPDWLAAALDVGIPIMLWRRQDCVGTGHTNCTAEAFFGRLIAALSDISPDQLPVEVMKLRKYAKSPVTADEQHCGHGLTLFWDDPTRMPDPPLAMGKP